MDRVREVLRRVGGPDAISLPAFWVVLTFSLLVHFAFSPGLSGYVVVRVVITVLAVVGMFGVLLLGRATVLRDIASCPRPGRMIALFVVSSVVRGAIIAVAVPLFIPGAPPQYVFRIATALVTLVPILVITAIIVSSLRAHRTRVASLMAQEVALAGARAQSEFAIADRQADLIEGIRERLIADITAIDPDQPPQAVAALQATANDVVRPLSHELASRFPASSGQAPTVEVRGIDWRSAFDSALAGRPLVPALIGPILLVGSLPMMVASQGVAVGVVLSAVFAISGTVLTYPANALLSRILAGRDLVFRAGVFLVVTALIGVVSAVLVSAIAPRTEGLAALRLTMIVGVLVLGALSALLVSVRLGQEDVESRMVMARDDLAWQVARTNQIQWFQQLQISRALHGPIQTAINAAAIRIDGAIRRGDLTDGLIAETKNGLLAAFASMATQSDAGADIDEAIDRLSVTWDGICSVRAEVNDGAMASVKHDPVGAMTIIEIMSEATSNAVRHGHASRVDIAVARVNDGLISVDVVDNGNSGDVGLSAGGGGLGSQLMRDCSVLFERTSDPGGTCMRVHIPTANVRRPEWDGTARAESQSVEQGRTWRWSTVGRDGGAA